jgi:preprotein translocase subunit YajC
MFSQFTIFLAQAAQPSPLMNLWPMALIMIVFYFLLIAPMRKRQKELQAQVDAIQKGDTVITSGGLYGKVAGIDGKTVFVEIADKVKVRVAKSAINSVEGKDTDRGEGKGASNE